MAWEGTLTTEAECNSLAGENVDATGWVEANKNAWVKQAEAFLTILGKYDFVTNYASISANFKPLLSEYCARYAAMNGILYNQSGYIDANELTDNLQVEMMLNAIVMRLRAIEKLIENQDFINFLT